MKRVFLFLSILLLLTGCKPSVGHSQTLSPPVLNKSPMEGKWTITKCIFTEENKINKYKYKNMIGKDSIFSMEGVIIANSYIKKPSFSVKKVATDDFLLKKYGISRDKLGVKTDSVQVVDVYDRGELFYQILREKPDVAYVDMNGVFVQISKISDTVSSSDIQNFIRFDEEENAYGEYDVLNLSDNGFILGLSTPFLDKNSGLIKWSYDTYFFRFLEDNVEFLGKRPGLILPRQDGFYQVVSERKEDKGLYRDEIRWSKLKGQTGASDMAEGLLSDPGLLKKIVYLSPDYINIENCDYSRGEKNFYYLYYLNTLKSKAPLGLSDFVEDGEKLFTDTGKLNSPGDKNTTIDEHNLGLLRNNGRWKFVGRINIESEDRFVSKNFDLNAILPKDMVKYEDLFVPMPEIKKSLPEVRDAFTSPNNRFLITLEEGHIKVYNIVEGKISLKPIRVIQIDDSAETVMTEWSIGRYVELWKNQFEGDSHE